MAHALALTVRSVWITLSALFLRRGNDDAPILLVLYVCVAAAFLAWLALPFIDMQLDASSASVALAFSP